MNVMLALTAAKAGACMNNYVEVVDLIKDQGRVVGVRAKNVVDGEVFDVKAKVVVSAAGPWTDELRKLDEPSSEPIVVASSGVHVVLPDYYSPRDKGLLDPQSSDGRVVFVLPWNGKTIAGTTGLLARSSCIYALAH
jgi:glycerol-3-phosphate dehydrogenase